jgi:hypothetical protein
MIHKALFASFFFLIVIADLFAETGNEIMEKVLDNQQVESSAMDIEMTLINANGKESKRRIQTLAVDNEEVAGTITVFLAPASVKNTRFLTLENEGRADDQWIYLPSLRKVRRIAATEQDSSFMGSDFSYSDMSFSQNTIEQSTHTLLRDETLSGRTCAVVESVPLPESESSYEKQISWVDRETWLPIRVEFYASGSDTPEKLMEAGDLKRIDGRWITGSVTMKTVESGHRTELVFRQIKYGIPLDPAYFTTAFLETGRKP